MSCFRDDGTTTYLSSPNQGAYFVVHDLLHYAVETTLAYRQAFFGLIADGRDVDDFGTRNGRKEERALPWEAMAAEQLVGILQGLPSGNEPTYAEFQERCEMVFSSGEAAPAVNPAQLIAIWRRWQELRADWRELPEEGVIDLIFPVASDALRESAGSRSQSSIRRSSIPY